jgi:hypothetical protein
MSKKTVAFNMAPIAASAAAQDQWVNDRVRAGAETVVAPTLQPAIQQPAMKRFTIDVEETLHKRIKAECAMRGAKMADVIRDLLVKAFPSR